MKTQQNVSCVSKRFHVNVAKSKFHRAFLQFTYLQTQDTSNLASGPSSCAAVKGTSVPVVCTDEDSPIRYDFAFAIFINSLYVFRTCFRGRPTVSIQIC